MATETATALLPIEELLEVLHSPRRRCLVIGGKVMPGQTTAIRLYRGDLEPVMVPLAWFVSRPGGPQADPTRLSVTDYGQTVCLGEYEASAEAILLEFGGEKRARDLDLLLADLAETQCHEEELLTHVAALLEGPAPGVPTHIMTVFAQAKEVFGPEAARFLTTPHWLLDYVMPLSVAQEVEGAQRVKDPLGRISAGVCV